MQHVRNSELIRQVEKALVTLRPYLQKDGGDVEVVEVTSDGVARLRLLGNCEGCPMSFMTMKAGIEDSIRRAVPEVRSVEAINPGGG